MKTNERKKVLRFGDFIANVYESRGKQKARELVRLFVNSHFVVFRGRQRYTIS